MTKYDKEYFIKKFEAIPDNEIGQGSLMNHCALHHVGVGIVDGKQTGEYYSFMNVPYITEESFALITLFGGEKPTDFNAIYAVNDDPHWGKTPKERILNKLKSLS